MGDDSKLLKEGSECSEGERGIGKVLDAVCTAGLREDAWRQLAKIAEIVF